MTAGLAELITETLPYAVKRSVTEKQLAKVVSYTESLSNDNAVIVHDSLSKLRLIYSADMSDEERKAAKAALHDTEGPDGELFRLWLRKANDLTRSGLARSRDIAIGVGLGIVLPVVLTVGAGILLRGKGPQSAITNGKTGMGLDPDIASLARAAQTLRNQFVS